MQRIPHNGSNGAWVKQYRYTNLDPTMSRYSLDDSEFLVYTINASIDSNNTILLETAEPVPDDGIIEIKFGQHFVPQRNLQLFTKFYYDTDLKVLPENEFTTFSEHVPPEEVLLKVYQYRDNLGNTLSFTLDSQVVSKTFKSYSLTINITDSEIILTFKNVLTNVTGNITVKGTQLLNNAVDGVITNLYEYPRIRKPNSADYYSSITVKGKTDANGQTEPNQLFTF